MKKCTFYFPCQKDFWQGLKTFVLALLVVSGCIAQSKAQTVSIDPTFSVSSASSGGNVGLERAVTKVIIQPDGKIIAGGIFRNFVGAPNTSLEARRIVRLNANGSRDASFNTGQGFSTGNNVVNAMVLYPDGKIIIGGNLDSYDNLTGLGHIARANSDGSRDVNFNNRPAGSAFRSFNNPVYALLLQPDGKVVVGGGFDTYNQSNVNPNARRIARLNPDGIQDLTFNNGGSGFNVGVLSGAGVQFAVFALALQSDGKIIAGGDFTTYNGVAARKIIRLNSNGSVDASFNVGMGFSDTNQLYAIALQNDGKVLVGGNFTSFNGVTSNYILRLNTDGSRDASFNIGTGFNSYVNDILIQPDGKIIVAGNFTSFNNATANYLIRLNSDGTRDNTFTTGNIGFDGEVFSIALQPDNKIVAGGAFVRYNGTVVNHLTRLNIASTPTITTTGTLTAFSTCAGTPSATQTYTVSGSNLTTNISIAAPAGFEISSNGTSFSNTLTLNASNGAVANTTITVRLAANASGSPSGNITHTSGTATPRNVAVTGTVNALPTITLGTIPSITTTATSIGIPYTATSGSPNQYSISAGANALAGFVAVSNQALPASPITLTLPATKAAGTYNFNLTVRNSTTGCVSAVVPFSVVVGTATSTPTITLTGTLRPFNSYVGSASNVQTYTLSVTNVTEDLVVTPPAGFQISGNGTDYFVGLIFSPPTSGTGSATISVRLAANASGSPSGNITHTSGTVTQNLAVSGTVNPIPTITLGTIESINTRSTSFTIPYTATTGSPNQFSLTAGANALPGFVPINKQTLPASPITIPIPQNTVAGNYNFNLIVHNSTTGCESMVIPFTLNNVMSAIDEEFSNSILAYPNPTTNMVTVQFPKSAKIETIRLLNPLGQEVMSLSKQEIQEQLQVDLSSFASGIYYLHVIEQKRVAVKRINLTK